jgi:hypothetical protein
MTLTEITNNLNKSTGFQWKSSFPAKLWTKDNIARIYIGNDYVQIVNGKVTVGANTSKGYYERKSDFMDRKNYVSPICQIAARYISYFLAK